MPIATLTRIMRRVLPDHAKVADDAKETIQECVSEFISFITNEANERCHREYRRTVTPNDVVSAMEGLGFGSYVEPLTVFINKHRAQQDCCPPPRQATHQPPPPQMARLPGVDGYVPSPPAVDVANYLEMPQMRDYFVGPYRGSGGGGGGGGGGDQFDHFK
ncbi:hypothetical protein SASPL_137856 [Salvia splendens]|uniref:Transcription factor CBF/NF-Y/archaeal histone domain-containing protein n=2 Tax=Salvia splendens TaxID=180675 RepID=A0A8X8WW01_SALSN|nr:hypothetical protein SASPL_137856 [Salvia splendens]